MSAATPLGAGVEPHRCSRSAIEPDRPHSMSSWPRAGVGSALFDAQPGGALRLGDAQRFHRCASTPVSELRQDRSRAHVRPTISALAARARLPPRVKRAFPSARNPTASTTWGQAAVITVTAADPPACRKGSVAISSWSRLAQTPRPFPRRDGPGQGRLPVHALARHACSGRVVVESRLVVMGGLSASRPERTGAMRARRRRGPMRGPDAACVMRVRRPAARWTAAATQDRRRRRLGISVQARGGGDRAMRAGSISSARPSPGLVAQQADVL